MPRSASALVLQVRVDAAGAGQLKLWPSDDAEPTAASASYSSGSSSFTSVVPLAGAGLVLRSSAAARVSVSAIGYVTGGDASVGGMTVVDSSSLVDMASGEGGALPAPGASVQLPVTGLGGVPSTGVRAVWLAVQARGSGRGVLTTGHAGDGAGVAYSARWTTELTLAAVDDTGAITYGFSGTAPAGLRIAVVGWVADTTAASTAPASPGLVSVPTTSLPLHSHGQVTSVRLDRPDLPDAVSEVLVRLAVATGRSGGDLRARSEGRTVALAPLSSSTSTSITAVVSVSGDGRLDLLVPTGSHVTAVVLEGYLAESHRGYTDRTAPEIAITSPANGVSVDPVTDPELVVSGTVEDTGSGVREVVVASETGQLGLARISSGSGTSVRTWSYTTAVPEGAHQLTVTAVDWAGRSSQTSVSFSVEAVEPDDVVIAPDARVLTSDEVEATIAVTPDTLELGGAPAIAPGDVLVSGVTEATPEGLLRRVESVERRASTTVVTTRDAALTEVFLSAHIDAQDVPLGASDAGAVDGAESTRVLRGAVAALNGAIETPPITFAPSAFTNADESLSLEVSSTLTLSVSATVDIDMAFYGWSLRSRVNELSLVVGVSDEIALTAEARAALAEWSAELALGTVALQPVTLMAGPVPVVFTFSLDPYVYAEASASVALTTTASATFVARLGVSYDGSAWKAIDERSVESGLDAALTGEVRIQGGLGLDLDVKLYGAAGPYIGVRAGLERTLSHQVGTGHTEESFDLVVTGRVGAKILELEDWSKDIAEVRIPIGHSEPSELGVDWSAASRYVPFVLTEWPAGGQSAIGVCDVVEDLGGWSTDRSFKVVITSPPAWSAATDRYWIPLTVAQGFGYECTLDVYDQSDPTSPSAALLATSTGRWVDLMLW